MFLVDRKFRLARIWSNRELKKIAHLFSGDIVNVSAWKDQDKEGHVYKEYFSNAANYFYTNYNDKKGISYLENEFFCDLRKELPQELSERFDVVFNHTTLEHIFEVREAFANICKMSRDIVILVVPFAQIHHGGTIPDYWRFTPQGMESLFNENKMKILYASKSNHKNSAIYLFYVASKKSEQWQETFSRFNCETITNCGDWIGYSFRDRLKNLFKKREKRFLNKK